jgi:hypothetical protein
LARTLTRNRLVALLAAVMLIACSALYSAHGLSDRAHEHEHCDLCVHLSGSAGSPAQVKVVCRAELSVRAVALPVAVLRALPAPSGLHLPRGPPRKPSAI